MRIGKIIVVVSAFALSAGAPQVASAQGFFDVLEDIAESLNPMSPPSPIGNPGLSRDLAYAVQVRLNELGFDAGTPDGRVGPTTRSGISAYQRSMGYAETGRLTGAEIERLLSLQASEIEALQRVLADEGYYDGEIDGLAGIETSAAISEFLKERGEDPDQISLQGAYELATGRLATPQLVVAETGEDVAGPEFIFNRPLATRDHLARAARRFDDGEQFWQSYLATSPQFEPEGEFTAEPNYDELTEAVDVALGEDDALWIGGTLTLGRYDLESGTFPVVTGALNWQDTSIIGADYPIVLEIDPEIGPIAVETELARQFAEDYPDRDVAMRALIIPMAMQEHEAGADEREMVLFARIQELHIAGLDEHGIGDILASEIRDGTSVSGVEPVEDDPLVDPETPVESE